MIGRTMLRGMGMALLGMLAGTASAADIYVRAGATGDGSAPGSPAGELWRAMERAVRGDVIHVAQGTYNGKGGSGNFTVKTPNLTLVGGYAADFSGRDPFRNFTILERARDYRGDTMGLGEGIVEGKSGTDHSGFTIDGFVLNSASRNAYYDDGKINAKKSWHGSLFQINGANLAIRNCILLNPYGDGIYCVWKGEQNEISNTFVLNTFYSGIATRSAQPDSVVRIRNCTVAFCWFQPGKGGGMAVFVGRQGQTILENNIFAFAQTEGDEAGFAVCNGFGNDETVMKDNVFFQAQGGYYKYLDGDGKNLLAWKPEDLADLNANPGDYMLAESGGNAEVDPKLMPDKDYFEKFSNFVASTPGKLKMDFMNEWRRSVGLPLQAEPGSPRSNWGMEYPLDKVIPNLVSGLPNRGPQVAGPFRDYRSATGAATAAGAGAAEGGAVAAATGSYADIAFDSFKKGAAGIRDLQATPVQFPAGIGSKAMSWLLPGAPRENYTCVMLLAPGKKEPTRDAAYGYLLNGSAAHKAWEALAKKKDKVNAAGGIVVKGQASYLGNDSYAYPVGIVIDEVAVP